MEGDDRSRFCADCRQPVFDLSELTTAEAAKLLSITESPPCVRFHHGPDGRVMTADCPAGLRVAIWRRLRRRAAWGASLFAVLFLQACRAATLGTPVRSIKGQAAPIQQAPEEGTEKSTSPAGSN
jgi:hypothetical protein